MVVGYRAFLCSAFMVPETAVTCTAASLPAMDVIVAIDDLTMFSVAKLVRKTEVFCYKS